MGHGHGGICMWCSKDRMEPRMTPRVLTSAKWPLEPTRVDNKNTYAGVHIKWVVKMAKCKIFISVGRKNRLKVKKGMYLHVLRNKNYKYQCIAQSTVQSNQNS